MPYGVSNSFKRYAAFTFSETALTDSRGTIKSYFHQNEPVVSSRDGHPPQKRTHLSDVSGVSGELSSSNPALEDQVPSTIRKKTPEPDASSTTVPSSPGQRDAQVFSDHPGSESDLSSPPSSPPPRLISPAPKAHKTTFSFLKRKRSANSSLLDPSQERGALGDIAHNARKIPPQRRRSASTQMQIDLGGDFRKQCRTCGMDYISSNTEDAALHQEFHKMNSSGVDVGKILTKDAATKSIGPRSKSLREGEAVLIVDRRSSVASRNQVKKILDVVNRELSAPEIPQNDLWQALESNAKVLSKRTRAQEVSDTRDVRFKAFLYLKGDTCIGCCLIEKISSAYTVVKPPNAEQQIECALPESSCISISEKTEAVLLGITRIWTSRASRRQGVAETLLDCARSHFFYGMEVTKDLVAFSQPTQSGAQLARRWYGTETGWHVFRDR